MSELTDFAIWATTTIAELRVENKDLHNHLGRADMARIMTREFLKALMNAAHSDVADEYRARAIDLLNKT